MKALSLKLDDDIFRETERITSRLHLAWIRYINESVDMYNRFNQRRLVKNQLIRESGLVQKDSMDILRE